MFSAQQFPSIFRMYSAQQIREYSVCLVHSKFVHIAYV